MFNIIYNPSQTIVSSHSTKEDAEATLLVFDSTPSSHEIIEVTDGNN